MADAPAGTTGPRRRVLFFGEAVTLAHVVRPVVLARSLDPARYDVTLACDKRFDAVLGELPFRRVGLSSISCERFLGALERGSMLYDYATLKGYVEEDLRILEKHRPDVVVGDFRLSLAVSARLVRVPYVTVTNAYWSPFARRANPLPDLPLTRLLGVRAGSVMFRLAAPVVMPLHTIPMNRLCRKYNRPLPGLNLRRVYTEADHVLYADVPELSPPVDLPPNHHYLGPILWSPEVSRPPWWDRLPTDRPVVYVTPGSSGRSDLLGVALRALADRPVTVIAATAGRATIEPPPNAFVAKYLSGVEAARRSALVVCNGGSPTTQQALAEGVPVLGLPANMDQHLNMDAVCRAGVGGMIRSDAATEVTVGAAVDHLLATPAYREKAAAMRQVMLGYRAGERFLSVLDRVFLAKGPPP